MQRLSRHLERLVAVAIAAGVSVVSGCATDRALGTVTDSGAATTSRDASSGDASPDGASDTSGPSTDRPPPVEDAPLVDYGTLPSGSTHAEGTIGAAGGALSGAPGSALAGVRLVVPPGALVADTTLSLDALSMAPMPPSGAAASLAVVVGPSTVHFALAARLTLPLAATLPKGQLGVVAEVGTSWSGLLAPSLGGAPPSTIDVDLPRGATVLAIALDLSSTAPSVGAVSPSTASVDAGDVLFVSGAGFGPAPLVDPAGVLSASTVKIDGNPVAALAWQDDAISLTPKTASSAASLAVQTPGGVATAPSAIAIGP
jgi:hypothetical protein